MNIFDGHEDKTPEELAQELGISDLTVVDNAGKETITTLEKIANIDNNISWTDNYSKSNLKTQMKIMNKGDRTTGTLLGFDNGEEEKVKVGFDNNEADEWISLADFFDTYDIPESEELVKSRKKPLLNLFRNAKAIKNWTKNYSFEDLEIGIRIEGRGVREYGKITLIDQDKKMISAILENGKEITSHIKDFIVFYAVFKEDLVYKDTLNVEDIKDDSLWEPMPDMMLGAKRGCRLKDINNDIYHLIDSEEDEFTLKDYNDGKKMKFSRDELEEFFMVFEEDISLF